MGYCIHCPAFFLLIFSVPLDMDGLFMHGTIFFPSQMGIDEIEYQ